MAALTITLTPADMSHLTESMRQVDAAGKDEMNETIGAHMKSVIDQHFRDGTLWDGSAMKQSKAAKERGRQTLVDQGHLRDSYTYEVNSDGVLLFGGHGAARQYAAFHHFGFEARTIKPKNKKQLSWMSGKAWIHAKVVHIPAIPARPVLGVNASDEAQIELIIEDVVNRYMGTSV